MYSDNKSEVRSESGIVAELESLSHEKGYIYSFCRMVDKYLWMKPSDPKIPDWHSQLNLREVTFLLGLMVKYQLTITDPPTKRESDLQINKTNELFHELHQTHSFPITEEVNAGQMNLEEWNSGFNNTYTDWIKSGKGIVESVFYGEEGAFDFRLCISLKSVVTRSHGAISGCDLSLPLLHHSTLEVSPNLPRHLTLVVSNRECLHPIS